MQSRFDARAADTLGPLIGREAELAQLVDLWQDVSHDAGRLCQILGTAGIGKSRLARELQERIVDQNPVILKLQCGSHLANRALHPITRELARAAGLAKSDDDPARLAKLEAMIEGAPGLSAEDLPLLSDLLGIGAVDALDMDVRTRVQLTHRMLLRWIKGMAEGGPVLLSFEDAHWADSTTQEFLALLISNLDTLPILLLVTFRPEFEPPWDIPGTAGIIDLEPLDVEAGGKVIEQITGIRHLPRALIREIIRKTDGVPLVSRGTDQDRAGTGHAGNRCLRLFAARCPVDPGHVAGFAHGATGSPEQRQDGGPVGEVIGREFSLDMVKAVAPPDLEVIDGFKQVLLGAYVPQRRGQRAGRVRLQPCAGAGRGVRIRS